MDQGELRVDTLAKTCYTNIRTYNYEEDMNSIRFTTSPYIGVRCPWTGQMVRFREDDAISDPDEILYWRGVGLGHIKASKKATEAALNKTKNRKKSKKGKTNG
jgi:hypothetical protein